VVIILCECDWGIGLTIPHNHLWQEKLRLPDGREFWMPRGTARLNPDSELLMEWAEVDIHVDWKSLYKSLTAP
jgi:hypothetical protein